MNTAGAIIAGGSLLNSLYQQFNPSTRRLSKNEYGYEKARAQAALDSIQRERAFRTTEDPREQAQLRQELAGRGLGKSSISTQNMGRLQQIQSNRNAELATNQALAERGLRLIGYRRLVGRRMQPFQLFGQLLSAANSAGGSDPSKGGEFDPSAIMA